MRHRVNIKSSKKFRKEPFLIADFFVYICEENVAISIKHDKLLANQHIKKAHLEQCNHKETDTPLFLQVCDAALADKRKVIIVGNGTSIVVIPLYIFFYLKVDKLWTEYSCGNNYSWLPTHEYIKLLCEKIRGVLSFWYAPTG